MKFITAWAMRDPDGNLTTCISRTRKGVWADFIHDVGEQESTLKDYGYKAVKITMVEGDLNEMVRQVLSSTTIIEE